LIADATFLAADVWVVAPLLSVGVPVSKGAMCVVQSRVSLAQRTEARLRERYLDGR
jgi:hypothetical protein